MSHSAVLTAKGQYVSISDALHTSSESHKRQGQVKRLDAQTHCPVESLQLALRWSFNEQIRRKFKFPMARQKMKKLAALIIGFFMALSCSAEPILIEEKLDRTQGVFIKNPVYIRALAWMPEEKADTVILYFNGWPSISRIENDKTFFNGINRFIRVSMFLKENVGVVLMDCPTDQWGIKSWDVPTACDDSYRSSKQHVQDIERVIKFLKESHAIKNFYLMGHSHGTISAKLLGKAMAQDVAGVISSAAVTLRYKGAVSNFGWAGENFNMDDLKIPVLNIHHEEDGCWPTPYATVLKYSKNNLITVQGGIKNGPVCGGGNYHSYEGNEIEINKAIIKWIQSREVTPYVGLKNN